jgi:hypothetical protein
MDTIIEDEALKNMVMELSMEQENDDDSKNNETLQSNVGLD